MNTITTIHPADLLTDRNIRTDPRLDSTLVESIRSVGIVQPIIAIQADDGLRVRAGHRRTAAALELGLESVPVVVVDDPDDDITRILAQYAENEHRESLTSSETVAAVEQLAALGVPVAQIAKQTQLDKTTVTAAQAVAAAKQSAQDALRTSPDLTITQAAAVAEFDDTPTLQEQLIAEIDQRAETSGEIDHIIARHVTDRDTPQAEHDAAAALSGHGITVIDAPGYGEDKTVLPGNRLSPQVSAEEHQQCPGHVEWSWRWGSGAHGRTITVTVRGRDYDIAFAWGCRDWRKHGHKDRWSSSNRPHQPEAGSEEAKQARRRVIVLNRAGQAAKQVREQWLTDFTARKKPAAAAALWSARAHLAGSTSDSLAKAAAKVADILGHDIEGWTAPRQLADLIANKPAAQVTHLLACLTLWEREVATDKQLWRGYGRPEYLRQLETWGYTLSEVEQVAVGDLDEQAAYTQLQSDQ